MPTAQPLVSAYPFQIILEAPRECRELEQIARTNRRSPNFRNSDQQRSNRRSPTKIAQSDEHHDLTSRSRHQLQTTTVGHNASFWRPAVNFRSTPKNTRRTVSQRARRPVLRGTSSRPRHRKPAPCGRSAKSQAVACSPVLAFGRLRRHSSTARQYCPSSLAVARRRG
jgi:hypothetical protein